MAFSEAQKLFMATITEGIVLVFVTFVVAMLYVRFVKRKRNAALALAVAFSFWDVAIICLFVMRLLSYLTVSGRMTDYGISFSDFGINLGYIFSAISNVFIFVFCAIVFTQSPMFRKTGMFPVIVVGALNGITVGMLIGNTINTWPSPAYELGPTVYHLLLTFLSFGALIFFTRQPFRQSTSRWEKAGFRFIILSGIFGILIYLSFAIDVVMGDFVPFFDGGYTIFFFFAYVFALFMLSFAYLGYVMPDFVRNFYKEQEEKEVITEERVEIITE